jgi:hypothetical protein
MWVPGIFGGALGFATPAVLWGLVLLPLVWWLLRAVPPAPLRRRFPGVALLVGLRDEQREAKRTPWWLLLLRTALLAAAILGLAGPMLNPPTTAEGAGPRMVVLDGSWADARDWAARLERAEALVAEAGRAGRLVGAVVLTDPPLPGEAVLGRAADWAGRVPGLRPAPFLPGQAARDWAAALGAPQETVWLSDGIEHAGRAALLAAFERLGPVRVIESSAPLVGIAPMPQGDAGAITLGIEALPVAAAREVALRAIGPDPAGVERELARRVVPLAAGATQGEARFEIPPELRNRIVRFDIEGMRSAAAVVLGDDALRRRKVALVGTGEASEALPLVSAGHYLRNALAPSADLIEGTIGEVLDAAPDAVILADVGRIPPAEAEALRTWIEAGGTLLRFAGPRLAAMGGGAVGVGAGGMGAGDGLLPVELREGGRTIGGAMSWESPRRLAPFPEGSPFAGLTVPEEVTVTAQVLAVPGPDLGAATIAALADGTPLVTRRAMGGGQVVLFHVTANADWSNLPLSGLFMRMLGRLIATAGAGGAPAEAELEGQSWQAEVVLDAFGAASDGSTRAAVPGARLAEALAGTPAGGATAPDLPPGLYRADGRLVALSVLGPAQRIAPAQWPSGIVPEPLLGARAQPVGGVLLALALVLLVADAVATLRIGGRLGGGAGGRARTPAAAARPVAAIAAAGLGGILFSLAIAGPGIAQNDPRTDRFAARATEAVVLAHVLTGEPRVDEVAAAGLEGLGLVLAARTSVEPAAPLGVDIERDELAFFPLLYWPVTADARPPSAEGYARLERYLRNGGMIVFDTRDSDRAVGGTTPEARRLREIAAPLDIPPLEQVPPDHVLTRSFYLIADFPGRHAGGAVWLEAAPADAETAEGMPFRHLNDGVSPVLIGGGDWAAAWAVAPDGMALLPVGRGQGGDRQREMAFRFGVNLVMYVLSGNYKSDQIHVPALLERLGQ